MTLDKIVYVAITAGVAAIVAGSGIVLTYEGRLSRLETQLGFVMGAQAASPGNAVVGMEAQDAIAPDGPEMAVPGQGSSGVVASAVAEQCAALMTQYTKIVSGQLSLMVGDQDKLDAISKLLDQMGCAGLTKPQ